MTLTDFAQTHGRSLNQLAYVLCGDRVRAEDLVQDAYLAMYRRFGEELDLDAPVAYARRTIVNAHISLGRRRSNSELTVAEFPDIAVVDAVDHGEQDEMWQRLATLPDRQRAALVLRYYLDLPDQDIAEALACRPGTVRSLLTRGLASLRADLSHPKDGGAR